MEELKTWRDLLGSLLNDPEEAARLSQALGVNPVTLARWASGKNSPRPHALRQLFLNLPEHRQQLVELIEAEYTGFFAVDEVPKEIPAAFYAIALRAYRETPNRFWPICGLILQQALIQLDSDRLGMEIIVVRCMPPRQDGKIRSLRESIAMGTPPWRKDLQPRHLFLGAESLAGYAVTNAHAGVIQNTQEDHSLLPVHQVKYARSVTAVPLMREGGAIAGCLLVSSTQTDYFSPQTLRLIELYADLVTLALYDGDFYPSMSIELRVMPPFEIQQKAFSSFRERVESLLVQSIGDEQPMNPLQAEQLVRAQLEKQLLQWHATRRAEEFSTKEG